MARIRRNSEQTLEFKIEQAEAKVARTREAHEKAVDELKKQGYEFVTVSELLGNVTSDVSVFHYARNYSR